MLFDVCNDYSLDPCDKPELFKREKYTAHKRTIYGEKVTLFFEKETDELHYLEGPEHLKGRIV